MLVQSIAYEINNPTNCDLREIANRFLLNTLSLTGIPSWSGTGITNRGKIALFMAKRMSWATSISDGYSIGAEWAYRWQTPQCVKLPEGEK